MPKILGSSPVAILIALIVFYMLGFLIYGVVFSDFWLSSAGMTEQQALDRNTELGAMMYVWGLVITLAQVLGISAIMERSQANSVGGGAAVGALLAVLIALPVMAYNWLYQGASANLLMLDLGHLFVGYCLAGAVLGYFRGRG